MQAYQPVGGGPILGNQPFTFTVTWGGKTVLTETGVAYWDVTTKPITFQFSDSGWVQNFPEPGWAWYKAGTFDPTSAIGMTLTVPYPLASISWPTPTWYSCPSQTCHAVPNASSGIGGSDCLTSWSESDTPQASLTNPALCPTKLSLLSTGTYGGAPGLALEELYLRGLGNFNYSFKLTLDGAPIINQGGFISVGSSYQVSIGFTNPGWVNAGGFWQWNYSGPISAAPVVQQVLTLDQVRCLYRPNFPAVSFFSQ